MISAYNQKYVFTSRHMVNIVTRRAGTDAVVGLPRPPEYVPGAYPDLIR
jgi:hypothetical protein